MATSRPNQISARISDEALANIEKAEAGETDRKRGWVINNLLENISVSKPKAKAKTKAVAKPDTEVQAACKEIWASYKQAYLNRYGHEPVRNAKVSSQIKQINQRLGIDARAIAHFYLTINDQFVLKSCHSVGVFLQNCEAYATQWKTGQQVTTTTARRTERTHSNLDAAQEAIRILDQKRGN